MSMYIELTDMKGTKFLTPLGTFDVVSSCDGKAKIFNLQDPMNINTLCQESYEEIKALIMAAQKDG